ncbi:hypothetical protein [Zavarzinia sp. CC-PAN008]|uniref:hypothetical protein n=1 Tax=Zavarzinia sp. CC-PAN008 TaxID=3243332 RepID=UPI003F745F92
MVSSGEELAEAHGVPSFASLPAYCRDMIEEIRRLGWDVAAMLLSGVNPFDPGYPHAPKGVVWLSQLADACDVLMRESAISIPDLVSYVARLKGKLPTPGEKNRYGKVKRPGKGYTSPKLRENVLYGIRVLIEVSALVIDFSTIYRNKGRMRVVLVGYREPLLLSPSGRPPRIQRRARVLGDWLLNDFPDPTKAKYLEGLDQACQDILEALIGRWKTDRTTTIDALSETVIEARPMTPVHAHYIASRFLEGIERRAGAGSGEPSEPLTRASPLYAELDRLYQSLRKKTAAPAADPVGQAKRRAKKTMNEAQRRAQMPEEQKERARVTRNAIAHARSDFEAEIAGRPKTKTRPRKPVEDRGMKRLHTRTYNEETRRLRAAAAKPDGEEGKKT